MGFLKFVWDIIVFILSLGVLIIVHELGHMLVAKAFKVYCYEFSLGMGPAIYQKKPKPGSKQETVFSIRAFPVGGYVAMAGEDDDDGKDAKKDEIVVPKERTIEGISHTKKALIMVAGVAVNFIIGYLIFFIDFAVNPKPVVSSPTVTVLKDSKVALAGLETGDRIVNITQTFYFYKGDVLDSTQTLTQDNIESYTDIQEGLSYAKYTDSTGTEYEYNYTPLSAKDYREVSINFIPKESEETKNILVRTDAVEVGVTDENVALYEYDLVGVSVFTRRVGFGNAFVEAGKQWAYGCGAIFTGVIRLFTPQGWSEAGGIVSMFKISSMATSSSFSTYLTLWGLISVNLAIFNLLPFPGLDGWQLVVTVVEGVSKKEVPNKFKQIASIVGMVLLFGLMIVLVIKDIFFPII